MSLESEVELEGWMPPSEPDDETAAMRVYQPGDVVAGKYELNRVLGEGGMGEVWVARNRDLDVDVAVKLIRATAHSGDSADRLLREAQAAARLSGPAIVRVFDFGKSQFGDPFIVMELLEGEDLAHALQRRGRLSPIKAVRIILPILQALGSAHAIAIVHRDMKPENIFLAKTPSGHIQPKLLDFGVAKFGRGRALRLTQAGTMLGSPLYMSPEQARGDDVDFRADIWAVCVVLYEVITGRAPFDGKNYNAVLYSIIANEPPTTPSLGAGDEELWSIIQRGLKKDPDHRWGSISEFGQALARWLLRHDQIDDITGVSLQATWLESASQSVDPLETMHPPASEVALDEAIRRLPTVKKLSPFRLSRVSRRLSIAYAAAAGLGLSVVVVALALLLGGGSDSQAAAASETGPGEQSSRESERVAAPQATAELPMELDLENVHEGDPMPAEAENQVGESSKDEAVVPRRAVPRKSSGVKNSQGRTTLKKLKNPFQ